MAIMFLWECLAQYIKLLPEHKKTLAKVLYVEGVNLVNSSSVLLHMELVTVVESCSIRCHARVSLLAKVFSLIVLRGPLANHIQLAINFLESLGLEIYTIVLHPELWFSGKDGLKI